MALSGDSRTRHQVDPDAFGVLHAPPPYAYRCPYGSATAEECGNRAAGHVGELIDEDQDVAAVISAFDCCGEWFAWQRYGEEGRPDLMTLAKGLTGAHLPLGAVVLSAEIARRLENEMLYTGMTYCGHPLSLSLIHI